MRREGLLSELSNLGIAEKDVKRKDGKKGKPLISDLKDKLDELKKNLSSTWNSSKVKARSIL